mmetsp:Transcript_102672/g.257373  ORF Transcript_102672/g.257373 Transcript_102672/m.257373 type:complete len:286 (+) Transcript_102672:743-1600(+)
MTASSSSGARVGEAGLGSPHDGLSSSGARLTIGLAPADLNEEASEGARHRGRWLTLTGSAQAASVGARASAGKLPGNFDCMGWQGGARDGGGKRRQRDGAAEGSEGAKRDSKPSGEADCNPSSKSPSSGASCGGSAAQSSGGAACTASWVLHSSSHCATAAKVLGGLRLRAVPLGGFQKCRGCVVANSGLVLPGQPSDGAFCTSRVSPPGISSVGDRLNGGGFACKERPPGTRHVDRNSCCMPEKFAPSSSRSVGMRCTAARSALSQSLSLGALWTRGGAPGDSF